MEIYIAQFACGNYFEFYDTLVAYHNYQCRKCQSRESSNIWHINSIRYRITEMRKCDTRNLQSRVSFLRFCIYSAFERACVYDSFIFFNYGIWSNMEEISGFDTQHPSMREVGKWALSTINKQPPNIFSEVPG